MIYSHEDFRIMARRYFGKYNEGKNAFEAMEETLQEFSVPEMIRGTVAEKIKNYRSETVISLPRKTVFTFRRRLGCVGRTFTQMSLPNGDRD